MKANNFQILVLAAGKGKRMRMDDLPKVLVRLKGKHMITYLLDAIKKSGVCDKPAIVVGNRGETIKKALSGEIYTYIHQKKQLGTGHAVMVAKNDFRDKADNIMILYGDHPLVSPALIERLADAHLAGEAVLTMATLTVPDYDDWRSEFKSFGKIIRSSDGKVTSVVEVKDATPKELEINELNVGYYCFKADWLWQNIDKLSQNNAQREYYLTDLVALAVERGIQTISVDNPQEALGVNTSEQLEMIEGLL